MDWERNFVSIYFVVVVMPWKLLEDGGKEDILEVCLVKMGDILTIDVLQLDSSGPLQGWTRKGMERDNDQVPFSSVVLVFSLGGTCSPDAPSCAAL